MTKSQTQRIADSIPTFISQLAGYLKSLVSLDNKRQVIDNASGSIGFLIQLFAKPVIDSYYDKQTVKKLSDYGFNAYCKAAFTQIERSLAFIRARVDDDIPIVEAGLGMEKVFLDDINSLEKKLTLLVFQPKYHPAVQMIKSLVCEMVEKLTGDKAIVGAFKRHFNENIEHTVGEIFADDYTTHKAEVLKFWFFESEAKLLIDTINNSKIGFAENEDLKYEEAYGAWIPLSNRSPFSSSTALNELEKFESNLKTVDILIDEYFSINSHNHLDKILFLVADFGKGKSVFLKQFAAKLAKEYLETAEGYFPIYFNLRSYAKYNRSDSPLGVIDEFLQTEYAIRISSESFISKPYIFLIDSLDESCDLTHLAVEKVLNSVRRIQNLDRVAYRSNKIVITTRPFDDVLFNLISHNTPYVARDEKDKEVAFYLSLYGFKKEQFNDWVFNTLKSIKDLDSHVNYGFVGEILKALKEDSKTDIHSMLLKNKILSVGELRRPIFAYMIYQLIKNNINITKVGKIGIYLSFLNLLSKEAKYINDPNFQISLRDQYEARSILHHIAALWLFERQDGKQGSLKKADICRMIATYEIGDSDDQVVDKYRSAGGNDIQFLSHSYFGENDNMLHFQHQSFAEILLAEYYLKVLIKCSLDTPFNLGFVVSKLKIGIPTDQTIEFFVELLSLLKETISAEVSNELIEKRRLLTPLLASIAIDKNNVTLYSPRLYYEWYAPAEVTKDTSEIPDILLDKWCIDETVIKGIIDIAGKVINSEKIYILSKTVSSSPLISREVSQILNSNYKNTLNIERSLALVAGNALYNTGADYFIRRFSIDVCNDLIRDCNYDWLKSSFRGISFVGERIRETFYGKIIANIQFVGLDFSSALFQDIVFANCIFIACSLKRALFTDVTLINTHFRGCNMVGLEVTGYFDIRSGSFDDFYYVPNGLATKALRKSLKGRDMEVTNRYVYHEIDPQFDTSIRFKSTDSVDSFFVSLAFYFRYCLKNGYLTEAEILATFRYVENRYRDQIVNIISVIKNDGYFHMGNRSRRGKWISPVK